MLMFGNCTMYKGRQEGSNIINEKKVQHKLKGTLSEEKHENALIKAFNKTISSQFQWL